MYKKRKPTQRKPIPIGAIYGMIKCVSDVEYIDGKYLHSFECECGNSCKKTLRQINSSINRGYIPSCGCLATAACSSNGKKTRIHGLSNTKLYDVYKQMIRRCHNPNCKDYPAWGARGIFVCQEWQENIHSFFQWAESSGYREGLTIERTDNSMGYSPNNCTWIPNSMQAKNTRRIRYVSAFGKTQSVTDWSNETGIPYRSILGRLNRGWSHERAVSK